MNNQQESKYIKNLTILIYLLCILAISRLLTLEIFQFLSDAISVILVFFYRMSRGKCNAIILLLNGLLGLYSGIVRTNTILLFVNIKLDQNTDSGYVIFVYLLLTFAVYSIIVYGFLTYLSILGITKYDWEFGSQIRNHPYMDLSSDNNNQRNNQTQENNRYVAFSGRGTTLG